MINPHIVRKTTSPTSAPPETGIHWINTSTNEEFFSIGTVNVSDWVRRGLVPSAETLTTNVYNQTGVSIPAFSVVYINGSQGSLPTVTLSRANIESTSSKTIGVTQTAIPNNGQGTLVTSGTLSNVNTNAFTDGDVLWLSPTVYGGVTTTKPTAPNHAVFVGYVIRAHPTLGKIEVKIQNGYELDELHNVLINGVTDGQALVYETSTLLWKNKSITKASVGLSNVDNTSDLNKPISTATQTALNAKEDTIIGAATTITSANLSASKALVSDASGKVAASSVTSTTLGFLDATSSVQTQINSKANDSVVIKKDGSVAFTGDQSMGSHKLTNVVDPSNPQDAATKSFVESLITGLDWKQACHAATTASINLSSAPADIDSHSLTSLQRVLVKDQLTPSQNGIYIWNGTGSAMTRSSDGDTWDELVGAVVYIEQGTVNGGTKWNATMVSGGTLGVTSVTFTIFSAANTVFGTGTTGYNAYWNGSTNLSSEQFVNQTRGGFGADTSSYTGIVKASSGVFSASPSIASGEVTNASTVTGATVTNALNNVVKKAGDTMSGSLASVLLPAGSSDYSSILDFDGLHLQSSALGGEISKYTYDGFDINSPSGYSSTLKLNSTFEKSLFTETIATVNKWKLDSSARGITSAYSSDGGTTYLPLLPTVPSQLVVKKYVDDNFLPITAKQVVRSYSSSDTWTKPAGLVSVEVQVLAGGGGGASGRVDVAGTVRLGGGSGATGCGIIGKFDAADLPSSVTVTVGAGGIGGVAPTSNVNNPGGAGGTSSFGTLLSLTGGLGGQTTTTVLALFTSSTFELMAGLNGTPSNSAGGSGGTTGTSSPHLFPTPSSGAGGGIAATNTSFSGGAGGSRTGIYRPSFTAATAAAGQNANLCTGTYFGQPMGGGAGGGSSSVITPASNGGSAVGICGAGAGGGCSQASTAGAGGNGFRGCVIVIENY